MKLCVLETEEFKGRLRTEWGPYSVMFQNWLAPAMPDLEVTEINVAEGAPFPEDPAQFDGYLITGSPHGAYDDVPWIPPLEAFLRQLRDRKIPVTGICFGHQIMAQAYGGKVVKSDQGWQIGRVHYEGPDQALLAFHQDQVVELPPGAQITHRNSACPIAGLAYDFPALSVQFHPEFSAEFVAAILDRLAGHSVPQEVADAARRDLFDPVDASQTAQVFADFYRQHR